MAMEMNERLAGGSIGMLQLDIVLPSQHFGSRRKVAPEQRLMIAVLHDALECLQKHRLATDPRGRRVFQETEQWFLADDTDWPCAFECICEVLDLDANAVRQRLRVASPPQAARE